MTKTKGSPKFFKVFAACAVTLMLSFGAVYPAQAEEYVPPPEAFEGPGGWAVINPETGIVYGVIVGDWNAVTWEQVKNTRTVDGYMGCPAPCELRFQTRATEDGNVAGWHGTQTQVDENGQATQTNDGSVRYDAASGTFKIRNGSPDGTQTTQTLVPEKTSRDADGKGRTMDLSSGITDIRTSKRVSSGEVSATVDTYRSTLSDETVDTTIALPRIGDEGTVLEYIFANKNSSTQESVSDLSQVNSDLVAILVNMGFTKSVTSVDEETGEEVTGEVLDESNVFVSAVLTVARGIVDFLSSILGFSNELG